MLLPVGSPIKTPPVLPTKVLSVTCSDSPEIATPMVRKVLLEAAVGVSDNSLTVAPPGLLEKLVPATAGVQKFDSRSDPRSG